MVDLELLSAEARVLQAEEFFNEIKKLKSRIKLLSMIRDDKLEKGDTEKADMLGVEIIKDKKRLQEIE